MVGGLVQSINADAPDVRERIWGQLTEIENCKLKIVNCLILGLGGGTVAHLLTKKFGPIPIDGVELDPIVVEVGKKFFDLDKLSNLNIITANAIDFVANPAGYQLPVTGYQLIIVDLYVGSRYPTEAESPAFFAGLKNLTRPSPLDRLEATPSVVEGSGVIVFNRLSSKKNSGFEEKLREHFGDFRKKTVPSKFGGHNVIYSIKTTELRSSVVAKDSS